MAFKPATKEKSKLRLTLMGPSGSGKTYTALLFATTMGKKVAVIDSERGSASKYADIFSFDTCDMPDHAPQTYVSLIKEAEKAGYEVLVIDSLSHAWSGKGGALEQVDTVKKRTQSGNSFTAWGEVTPAHNALVDAMLTSKCHVITTMRTKQEYVIEDNDRGKKVPRKVGMAPVQREGMEYEFDVIADMNVDHDFIVSKTRCAAVDGLCVRKPGVEVAETLLAWVNNGAVPKLAEAAKDDSTASATSKPATSAQSAKPDKSIEQAATSTTAKPADASTQPTAGATATAGRAATSDPKSASGTTQADTQHKKTSDSASSAGSSPSSDKSQSDPGKTSQTSTSQGSGSAQKVGKEEMGQLLKVATDNGWNRQQVSDFLSHAFSLKPETMRDIAWKQWETAVGLVGRPENKNGQVTVNAQGKPLSDEHRWPKAAA